MTLFREAIHCFTEFELVFYFAYVPNTKKNDSFRIFPQGVGFSTGLLIIQLIRIEFTAHWNHSRLHSIRRYPAIRYKLSIGYRSAAVGTEEGVVIK